MKYGYVVEYIKREGYESCSLVVGDGFGNKRTAVCKPEKISNGYAQEVKVEVGDVIVAVRNRWEMVREKAEIILFGISDIVDGEPVMEKFDSFDGKYWDNKKHTYYTNLIDLALEHVGRVRMFEKVHIDDIKNLVNKKLLPMMR